MNLTVPVCRWRNSFLCGLLFGGPTMAIMIYYMLIASGAKTCLEHHNESAIAANATDADCHQMSMIVNGLSLRNLLLFIFCTPCQVRLSVRHC